MGDKIRVLMICAHEPSLDPRIRWEAEGAAHRFEVTVLGFNRPDSSCPAIEACNNYRIIRLPPNEVGALYYFWRLKDIMPRRLLAVAMVIGVALLPVLIALEFAVRLLRWGLRRAVLLARWLVARSFVLSLLMRPVRTRLGSVRGLPFARIHFILAVLRVQFAPAVAVFWNYLRDLPVKPDVVHCNDLDTLLVGVLAKRHYGCRLIFDAHEFWPVADSLCRWLDITFFSLIERLLIGKVDAVVTVNPMLGEAIRKAYRLPRVYSVPNVEPWVEKRPRVAARSAMDQLAGRRIKCLFQGRFTLARGIDELIHAWALVDGSKIALFLRGPDNMWRRKAMELAVELGLLDDSVFFLDAVGEDELVAAAAEADIGIVPYLPLAINERLSCPNKLSQYLHAGLMVITNDLPYVREVIDQAGAGLWYDSKNLATFAAAVDRVLREPGLLRGCQENALTFARERFNWQVHGMLLLELYEGGIDRQPAAGSPSKRRAWSTGPRPVPESGADG